MFKTGQNTLYGGAPLIQDVLAHFHDLWVFSLIISQGSPEGPFWPSLGIWLIFQNCHTYGEAVVKSYRSNSILSGFYVSVWRSEGVEGMVVMGQPVVNLSIGPYGFLLLRMECGDVRTPLM